MKQGLYATHFGGGQVDITSGKFVFSASEAYLIEDGKITAPVKGASLIGDGPTVLKKVTMVANDLQLDQGVGICSKEGQSIPVGVGFPQSRSMKSLSVARGNDRSPKDIAHQVVDRAKKKRGDSGGCVPSRRRNFWRHREKERSREAQGGRLKEPSLESLSRE